MEVLRIIIQVLERNSLSSKFFIQPELIEGEKKCHLIRSIFHVVIFSKWVP
jgi:hypothetical protein